jgi:hypothetical protein
MFAAAALSERRKRVKIARSGNLLMVAAGSA